jgi:hypothetical protein
VKRSGERPAPSGGRGSRATTEDESGDADTNAQLRAMRAVWLSMREDDPPDGGLVDLLTAARAKAATMRARPTVRQRVLAVLRRPPALAFATVVVLVGGAVLLAGRRDRTSSVPSIRLATPAVPTAPRQARDNGMARDDDVVRSASAGPGTASVPTPGPAGPAAPADTRAAHGDAGGTLAGAQRPPATAAKGKAASQDGRGPLPLAPAPHHARTAEPPPAAATSFDPESDAPAGDLETSTVPGPSSAPGERLYRQCERAAERGDCATVRRLIERITRQDRSYRARIAKDSAVGRCLASVE